MVIGNQISEAQMYLFIPSMSEGNLIFSFDNITFGNKFDWLLLEGVKYDIEGGILNLTSISKTPTIVDGGFIKRNRLKQIEYKKEESFRVLYNLYYIKPHVVYNTIPNIFNIITSNYTILRRYDPNQIHTI